MQNDQSTFLDEQRIKEKLKQQYPNLFDAELEDQISAKQVQTEDASFMSKLQTTEQKKLFEQLVLERRTIMAMIHQLIQLEGSQEKRPLTIDEQKRRKDLPDDIRGFKCRVYLLEQQMQGSYPDTDFHCVMEVSKSRARIQYLSEFSQAKQNDNTW